MRTAPSRPVDVSVLLPTYCEAENVRLLLPSLRVALAGRDAELLVLDDASPDGTADVADALAPDFARSIRRTGPRGLAHAVLEGFRLARGRSLVVMDADLSHPPEIVPRLLAALDDGADLAVGSRYVPGGGTEGWAGSRRLISCAPQHNSPT